MTCATWLAGGMRRCPNKATHRTGIIRSCGCPASITEVCEYHLNCYLQCRYCGEPTQHTEAVRIGRSEE